MKIKRRHLEPGVPAVAMADIAFNLVLFFIILARTQDDSHLKWSPAGVPKAELESITNSRVSVMVDKDNKVYLNGKHTGTGELAASIQLLLGNRPAGQRPVLLKIHKDTLAATFEPILEAVSQAGGDVVHVLAEEQK
jgi:biopolymer transport protein ExbD